VTTRREFLVQSSLVAAGAWTLLAAPRVWAGGGAEEPTAQPIYPRGDHPMPYELPELPYAYEALEPFLSAETLHLHHDKHHAGYVKGLNDTEDKLKAAQAAGDFAAIRALLDALAFNYSGHLLHSLFWTNMKPGGGGAPRGALAEQIQTAFGSFDKFKAEFLAATNAVQGSGWGILAWEPLGKKLVILQAEKHQNLAQWGVTPLLVLDVWEHAYYLQYQNRRPDFTAGFFEHAVNWDDVAGRLAAALA
jgi:Fe-Mn family superoxide dismutase